MRFGGDADGQMFEIHIPPRYESAFGIAKPGHEIKLEANLSRGVHALNSFVQFRVFVDWPDSFDEVGPVGCGEEFALAMLLHDLRKQDEFVVDALSLVVPASYSR